MKYTITFEDKIKELEKSAIELFHIDSSSPQEMNIVHDYIMRTMYYGDNIKYYSLCIYKIILKSYVSPAVRSDMLNYIYKHYIKWIDNYIDTRISNKRLLVICCSKNMFMNFINQKEFRKAIKEWREIYFNGEV